MKHIILASSLILLNMYAKAQTGKHNSWIDPLVVCSSEILTWMEFADVEEIPNDDFSNCIKPFEKVSQVWIKFKVRNSCDLAFEIKPKNPNDDIDFSVLASKAGIPGEVIRCIATGLELDKSSQLQNNCIGITGLREGESDNSEPTGCTESQNNFLKAISASQGDEFLLLITNYQSTEGFDLSWGEKLILDPLLCKPETDNFTAIKVSPNPAVDIIKCSVESTRIIEGYIHVVSQNGTLLQALPVSLIEGYNEVDIQSDRFAAGKYYLVLSDSKSTISNTSFEIIK